MSCIEIQGPLEEIINGLKCLTSPRLGLTFSSQWLLNGNHEGRVTLFRKDQYPSNPIGLVTFIWRFGEINPNERTLWIWAHPAFYKQVTSELQSLFGFESAVKLRLDQTKLNRFRLQGPLSYSVLQAALKDSKSGVPIEIGGHSPSFVTGVVVRDPRVLLPPKRNKPIEPSILLPSLKTKENNSEMSRSSIWDSDVRHQVSSLRKTIPDHSINEKRRQLLVPGTELPQEPDECTIPLLLINAPQDGNGSVFLDQLNYY